MKTKEIVKGKFHRKWKWWSIFFQGIQNLQIVGKIVLLWPASDQSRFLEWRATIPTQCLASRCSRRTLSSSSWRGCRGGWSATCSRWRQTGSAFVVDVDVDVDAEGAGQPPARDGDRLVVILLLIYILWCSVCLSVTKNEHFLKRSVCLFVCL